MKQVWIICALVVSGLAFAQSQFGDWLYSENIDLITDENTSFIYTLATDYPGYARASGLAIRCSAYGAFGVEVFFNADRYLGSDSSRSVTYRFDSGTPVSQSWASSTSNEAAFMYDHMIPGFLSALNRADQLVFRIASFNNSYTYVVPVKGLNDALYRLGCYAGTL